MIGGIDLSTKSVEVVLRVDSSSEAVWHNFPIPPIAGPERDALAARSLAQVFPTGAFWDETWLCGVEYPFARMGPGLGLKTVMGAVMALIPARVHVIPLPPGFWQPRFCECKMPRRSVERKPIIRARALEMGAPADWSQDAHDAYGLSWIVEQLNEEGLTPKIGQQTDLLAHT